jgi:hypothetical protein
MHKRNDNPATWDNLPFVAKKMHLSFENLAIINTPKSKGIFHGHPS